MNTSKLKQTLSNSYDSDKMRIYLHEKLAAIIAQTEAILLTDVILIHKVT